MKSSLPIIPKLPPGNPKPPGETPVAICGECGRTVYALEYYSCMNGRCPVQRKATL